MGGAWNDLRAVFGARATLGDAWRRRHRERPEALVAVDELVGGLVAFRFLPASVALGVGAAAAASGAPWGLVPVGVGLVLACPGTVTWALVRAGTRWPFLARTAAFSAWFDGLHWQRDRGGAVVVTALRMPDPETRALAAQRVQEATVLRAGTLFAAGLLHRERGEPADAEVFFALAAECDRAVRPRKVHRWVSGLRMLDRWHRRDWEGCVALAVHPRTAATPLVAHCFAAAAAVLGRPVPRWARLLRRAVLPSQVAALGEPAPDPTDAGAVWGALVQRVPTLRSLGAVARTADRLEAAWAGSDGLAWAEVRATARAELVDRARALRGPFPPGAGLSAEVRAALVAHRTDALRALVGELSARTEAMRPLPMLDEIRAWGRCEAALAALAELGEVEAVLAFGLAYSPLVRHTVWLNQGRVVPAVANAMYRVMARWAARVAHPGALALLQGNLEAGPF